MRAPSIRQAILTAAGELATPAAAPTLRELARAARVPIDQARWAVPDLRRAGKLHIVRSRRVPYRNRPVAEYAPAARQQAANGDRFQLDAVMRGWAALA